MEATIEKVEFQTYPAYKDSGVEWLGQIPECWELSRLGKILTNKSERGRGDLDLLSITREKGVIVRDLDNEEENHNFIPDDLSNYKVIRQGQFGMNKMKAWQGSYGVSPQDGIVSPAYFVFDLEGNLNPRFFHLAIRSKLYVSFFGSASDGVRIGQWDLSKERMKMIPFLIPPLPEQKAIAEFLDKKTALIHKAIQIKEKQIALLQERRQILIQQAVTRGLDPNVPLKDSGVDWIGLIPEHWEVCRNSNIYSESKRPGNDSLKILSVSIHTGVSSEELSDEENIRGAIRIEDKSSYKLVEPNDITFNMMRAWQGGIGAVKVRGMVSPAYVVASPKSEINSEFFEFQYRTPEFIQQMDRFSKGITDFRKRLYWAEFKQLITVLPPYDEQLQIVVYINSITLMTKKITTLKEQEIEKLKEYKSTLINSAVTGKIKI